MLKLAAPRLSSYILAMLDKPNKSKSSFSGRHDISFRALTHEDFIQAWNENRLTDVFMGHAAAKNRGIPRKITQNVVGELAQISEEMRHAMQTAVNRKRVRAFLNEGKITVVEFERVLNLSQNPAEHIYEMMAQYNHDHIDAMGPDIHFGMKNRKSRFYVIKAP